MTDKKADIEADISPEDDGESVALMEPMIVSDDFNHRGDLLDLATELLKQSTVLKSGILPGIRYPLTHFMRVMNCYYSNLIEGHKIYPADIEKAYTGDYSDDPQHRNLQLEAKAHIDVQEWIDGGGLGGESPTHVTSICEIHRRFYDALPEEMLIVEHPDTGEKIPVIPRELRTRGVKVGRHIPISAGAVMRFLHRFHESYEKLSRMDYIVATAASHHRFVWIHPFIDGNGRVARLMTHAMLLDSLDSGSLWTVSRGLARREADYKKHLAECDSPRRGDLDGRGMLSEKSLVEFTRFFLETCIDQVKFVSDIVQSERIRHRILSWAEEEVQIGNLPPQSVGIYEAILHRGELPRSAVAAIVGKGDRQARRITSALLASGTVVSDSPRAPLRLHFIAKLAERWLPGLLPE